MEGVLSLALVIITAIYAWLTWKIATKTGAAAEAATKSAEASERAAAAAQRAAEVAEAGLVVEFTAEFDRHKDGTVWITFLASTASIWVHSLSLDVAIVGKQLASGVYEMQSCPIVDLEVLKKPGRDAVYPVYLPAGEPASFAWPRAPLRKTDRWCLGYVRARYSLSEEGTVRRRSVYFETEEGLASKVLHANLWLSGESAPEDD